MKRRFCRDAPKQGVRLHKPRRLPRGCAVLGKGESHWRESKDQLRPHGILKFVEQVKIVSGVISGRHLFDCTNKSKSLPSVASPRVKEPKTVRLFTGCCRHGPAKTSLSSASDILFYLPHRSGCIKTEAPVHVKKGCGVI